MEKTPSGMQAKVLEGIKWEAIVWFVGLMLVASVLPRFVHNQFITGPIINATLFLAAAILGSGPAILIGLVPSVVALSSGLLPAPLAPMVPFIMISNAILILVFAWVKKINFGAGAVVAAFAKYAFLYATVTFVTKLISNHSIAAKAAATMMAWPQLMTALVGAIIAFGILKVIKKYENNQTSTN